jgi:hypothetical protein
VAKLLREKAKGLPDLEAEDLIKRSNEAVVAAAISAKGRGGISLSDFEWKALTPDWTNIDDQLARLPAMSDLNAGSLLEKPNR